MVEYITASSSQLHRGTQARLQKMKIMPTKTTKKKPATTPKAVAKKPAAPKAKKAAAITRDDLALRAYFIAEKRHKLGLPGDEHSDWLEAERQLAAESRPKTKSTKA